MATKQDPLKTVEFSAPVALSAGAADGPRSFSGIGYAGGVITDHPYYDAVAFDLASTRFQKTTVPILLNHETPIGVSDGVIANDVSLTGRLFSHVNPQAKEVVEMADAGMAWEMSVRIKPGRITEYKSGDKIKLNGRTFNGPLTVFRENRIREVSICALGADADTSANVFSIGGERIAPPTSEGNDMDQAAHDAALAAQRAQFEAQIAALTTDKKASDDRLAAVEASAAAAKLATRTEAVKGLFKAIGKEFNDANAKPYVEMSDESFAAASEAISSRAKLDPSLTEHTATGSGEVDKKSPRAILAAARKYQSEQFKIDSTVVPIDEAVIAVGGQISL